MGMPWLNLGDFERNKRRLIHGCGCEGCESGCGYEYGCGYRGHPTYRRGGGVAGMRLRAAGGGSS